MSAQAPTTFELFLARRSFPILLVAAVTLVGYSGTLGFEFIYDDFEQIVDHTAIRSWSYVPQYFSQHSWVAIDPSVAGKFYRPLFLLWLRINYVFLHLHPAGWHLVSVLCHVGVTLLTYRLVLELLQEREAAFVAALLFGLHPAHIDAVVWISAVSELLMTACVLGALLALARAQPGSPPWRWLVPALPLYVAAMLFKETGIIFLVLAGAYYLLLGGKDALKNRAALPGWMLAALALLPVTAAYLVVRWRVLHTLVHDQSGASWAQMAITWPAALLVYAQHLVFPLRLSSFYDFAFVPGASAKGFWWPCLVLLAGAATTLWVFQKRERRLALFALVLTLAPLAPVLYPGALEEYDLIHDRYLYLPSVGWVLLLALHYRRLRQPKGDRNLAPKLARVGVGVCAVFFFAALVTQQAYWANNLVFYSRGAETAPNNPGVLNNLGAELTVRGETARALVVFQRALVRDPRNWYANFNLGYLMYVQARYPEAERYLSTALSVQPTAGQAAAYLGLTELHLNRFELAQTHLELALVLRPDGYGIHEALALVRAARGDAHGYRRHLQAEVAKHPENLHARKALEALDKP